MLIHQCGSKIQWKGRVENEAGKINLDFNTQSLECQSQEAALYAVGSGERDYEGLLILKGVPYKGQSGVVNKKKWRVERLKAKTSFRRIHCTSGR